MIIRKSALEVLMQRDGLSKRQAKDKIEECRDLLYDAIDDGDEWEIEAIVEDYLDLGSEYVDDIL